MYQKKQNGNFIKNSLKMLNLQFASAITLIRIHCLPQQESKPSFRIRTILTRFGPFFGTLSNVVDFLGFSIHLK